MTGKASKQAGHATPAAGADNNTRLAFLEAGVSSLAIALTELGGSLEGNEPIDLAIAELRDHASQVKTLEETTTALAEAVIAGEHEIQGDEGALEAAVRILSVPATEATAGELAAIKRAEDAETAAAVLEAKVSALEAAIVELGDEEKRPGFIKRLFRRSAAEGTDGEAEAAAAPRDPVECGPTFGVASAAELRALLEEDDHLLELVLSDGDREMVEFRACPIARADLVRHGGGYMVNKPMLVAGAENDLEAVGAALLCDGEQVDFCPFDRPQVIGAGQQYQFAMTFMFGAGGGA